jgi:pimeloyl-ACP methyl ester carboxylesterase
MAPLKNAKKSTIRIERTNFVQYKGTVNVRLNYADSASELLSIPVHIIRSSSPTPAEPIYFLNGGPGQTNLTYKPSKVLLENHDFVLVGFRGVDGNIKLKSKKINKAMKGLDNQLLSNESLDNMELQLKRYAAELVEQGIDINQFTMIDVIEDFEVVRKKLGHENINLLSTSYGTRVALLYSYKYPQVIKRSLMVGVNPPGNFIWKPENTERILQTYDSLYKIQSQPDDLSIQESIQKSFEKMPKKWSFFSLDADKIKTISFLLLFQKSSAAMVFDAYQRAALKKDYSGLYFMQLAFDYFGMIMPFTYGDLFSKAGSADFQPDTDYRELLRPGKNEIGAPYSALLWGISKAWPVKPISIEYRSARLCNTETLMIGGNLDISTPPETATNELLSKMPNGKQIVLNDMAHCGDLMGLQPEAFNFMAVKYFNEGVVDTSKLKNDPVSFKPKMSFNKMAKWLYPIIFVMSLAK